MSNRLACFLSIRVHLNNGKHKVRLPLPPVALYVFHGVLNSLDGLIEFIPGKAGNYARCGVDAINTLVSGAMSEGPQEFVNLDIKDSTDLFRIKVRTL